MGDIVGDNAAKLNACRAEFIALFGMPLTRFMHPLFGFDIVAFDERVIMPPDGTSTKEAIRNRYGEAGVKLIERLI